MIQACRFAAILARPLLSVFVLCGPVAAQQGGAWVDPPDKARSEVAPEPSTPAEPRTPAAAKPSTPRMGMSAPAARPGSDAKREVGTRTDARVGGATLADAARRTVVDYLAAVSSSDIAASAPRFYGERVRFHGRTMSRKALAVEKARFARRWPDRLYTARGGIRTQCDAARGTCDVRTGFAFRAGNPERGARSVGYGVLALVVDLSGAHPRIISETSRVLRRGSAAVSAARRTGDAV